jgi:hypothetical protein
MRLVTATTNDPIVAAVNVYTLKNVAAGGAAAVVNVTNTVSINGLTGAQATGQPALESLNGVAVEAVVLPPDARR